MSKGEAINRDKALDIAELFIHVISLSVKRIEIAGSLRREKEFVHDIEIVAEPFRMMKSSKSLDYLLGYPHINSEKDYINALHITMQDMLKNGLINSNRPRKDNKKNPFGTKYYRINYLVDGKEYPIDLFVVMDPAQWGVIFLIRTGSAEFSHRIIKRAWDYGLKFNEGHIERSDGSIVNVESEKEIFELLHMPYIEPRNREAVEQE